MIWERETFAVEKDAAGASWLCLKFETTYSNKPVLVTHYWPFHPVSLYDLAHGTLQGIEGAPAIKGGIADYSWKTGSYTYRDFRLFNGGQTKPIKTTESPLPCPKVRKGIETRFYNGWWQKYTKAHGWENLPPQ